MENKNPYLVINKTKVGNKTAWLAIKATITQNKKHASKAKIWGAHKAHNLDQAWFLENISTLMVPNTHFAASQSFWGCILINPAWIWAASTLQIGRKYLCPINTSILQSRRKWFLICTRNKVSVVPLFLWMLCHWVGVLHFGWSIFTSGNFPGRCLLSKPWWQSFQMTCVRKSWPVVMYLKEGRTCLGSVRHGSLKHSCEVSLCCWVSNVVCLDVLLWYFKRGHKVEGLLWYDISTFSCH